MEKDGYEILYEQMLDWFGVEELPDGYYIVCFEHKYDSEVKYSTEMCLLTKEYGKGLWDWDFNEGQTDYKVCWVAEVYDLARAAEMNMTNEVKDFFKHELQEYAEIMKEN